MKAKTETAFAIMNGKILLPYSIRSTRRQCILHHENFTYTLWNQLKKEGCRVVKVQITVL